MKKIGIIGGAGPLAGALVFETIIRECYAGKKEIPEIFLINYPFTRILGEKERTENRHLAAEELRLCVDILIGRGVEIAILACNTLHLYSETLFRKSISFLSLPKTVMNEAKKAGHRHLLVLGTRNTCRSNLYKDPDLEICYPPPDGQMKIDRIIDRILKGKICRRDASIIEDLLSELGADTRFDGVVLGCTELPVLHHHFPVRSSKFIYDSIKIPARTLRGYL